MDIVEWIVIQLLIFVRVNRAKMEEHVLLRRQVFINVFVRQTILAQIARTQ